MIKVCHISTMTALGGVERMLLDLITRTEQQEVKHSLLTTSHTPELLEPLTSAGIDHFEPTRAFHYDPFSIYQMAKWLRYKNIDVVHTYNLKSNCWGGMAATLARVPLRIAGEHGTAWSSSGMLKRLETRFYLSADLIIANSMATSILLSSARKIPKEKIHVVHNGVEAPILASKSELVQLRNEFHLSTDAPIVGVVARLDELKNLYSWLDTALLISRRHENTRFVIVGGGSLSGPLQQYAESLGIHSQTVFTGWRDDARQIMQLFDVYLSTSLLESFGNTLVESAYCGKPVVAPAIDGIPEVVYDGKTGFLVVPDLAISAESAKGFSLRVKKSVINGEVIPIKAVSSRKLANKVCVLLEDQTLRRTMGEAARARAAEKFSIDRYIEDLETTYKMLYARTEK